MTVHRIVYYPDDPLTKKSEPIKEFDESVVQLATDLFESMDATPDGAGLAAPQIGISKRMFVGCYPESGKRICVVNPEIIESEGRIEDEEACLSLPGISGFVPRAKRVRVKGLDQFGHALDFEATDFEARLIQHETDHLNGRVFIDYLDIITRETKLQELHEIRQHLDKHTVL